MSRAIDRMSDQNYDRVSKRFSISAHASIASSFNSGDKVIIFSPSVEIFKNGPTLRKATEVVAINHYELNYQDLIATVDGLDLAVASIQSELSSVKCRPISVLVKSFSFGTKNVRYMSPNMGEFKNPKMEHSSHVDCCGRYGNYSYKMVDRLMAEQLWLAGGISCYGSCFQSSPGDRERSQRRLCGHVRVRNARVQDGPSRNHRRLSRNVCRFPQVRLHGTVGHAVFRQQSAWILC